MTPDTPTLAGWTVVLVLAGYLAGWTAAFLVLRVPGRRRPVDRPADEITPLSRRQQRRRGRSRARS